MPHADTDNYLTVPAGSRLRRKPSWSKESFNPLDERTKTQTNDPQSNTRPSPRVDTFAADSMAARRTRASQLYDTLMQASKASDTELIPKLDTETQGDYDTRLPTDATDKQREITAAERLFHQLWPDE